MWFPIHIHFLLHIPNNERRRNCRKTFFSIKGSASRRFWTERRKGLHASHDLPFIAYSMVCQRAIRSSFGRPYDTWYCRWIMGSQGGIMNHRGMAGCGCLIIILIIIMLFTGALMHPITLRFLGTQFHYGDRIFTSDAIFVPRFPEDRNGELYAASFQDFSAGNGKAILVEDDTVLGTSIVELVNKMAKARNVKDDGIKRISASGEGLVKAQRVKEQIEKQGLRK